MPVTLKIGEAGLTRRAKPAPFPYGVSTPKASPRAELVLMELATDYERLRGHRINRRLDATLPNVAAMME